MKNGQKKTKKIQVFLFVTYIFTLLFLYIFIAKQADKIRYDITTVLREMHNQKIKTNLLRIHYEKQTTLESLYIYLKKYGYQKEKRSVIRIKAQKTEI